MSTNGRFLFTAEIRQALSRKRRELGLTFTALGDFLGVSWATIRKWELGKSKMCQRKHAGMVENFLAGAYDRELSGSHASPRLNSCLRPLPREAVCHARRFLNTLRLLNATPRRQQTLVLLTERLLRTTLRELLARERTAEPVLEEEDAEARSAGVMVAP